MHSELLIDMAVVLGLGMLAQWVAWRLKQPSIIFLLFFGLLVGPFAALLRGEPILDVEHFLGELLFPVVSASVAVIMFEGGLSLRFRDLEGAGGVVGKLVTVGVLVTWILGAVAAYYILGLSLEISLLLGATLVVTGPTVIIPMLKQIRPKGRVGSILRWEGIVIDPVGAILAVLVFEEIITEPSIWLVVVAISKTLLIGGGIGILIGWLMIEVYSRYLVPDSLQSPITLGLVLAAFTAANLVQAESGLFTVTVMGIILANQRRLDMRHIVEFKENLQVLLLSALFILLSARMQPSDLAQIGLPTLAFALVLILVIRPIATLISTYRSRLNWRERVFIAWMAPRGIVAASVASVFTLELAQRGYEGAEALLPTTFAVIIITVAVYSLSSGILALRLGVAERNPQGLLIVGASQWVRQVAKLVKEAGFRVLLADTNQTLIQRAESAGLEAYHGNVLSEVAEDELNLGGIGRLLALTANAEVNALAGEHYASTFGNANIYELQRPVSTKREGMSQRLGGRTLFPINSNFEALSERFQHGARVMQLVVQDVQVVQAAIPKAILPLFALPDKEQLQIWTESEPPTLKKGMRLIAMVESEFYDELVEAQAIDAAPEELIATVLPDIEEV